MNNKIIAIYLVQDLRSKEYWTINSFGKAESCLSSIYNQQYNLMRVDVFYSGAEEDKFDCFSKHCASYHPEEYKQIQTLLETQFNKKIEVVDFSCEYDGAPNGGCPCGMN